MSREYDGRPTYKPDIPDSRGSGGRNSNKSSEMTYDVKTGKWVDPSYSRSGSRTVPVNFSASLQQAKGDVPLPSTTPDPPTPSVTESKVESKKQADKKFIDIEFNTLVGELNLIPNKDTIRIRVGQTINIHGVGKFLSGQYFVSAIRRTLNSSSGYTHTLTVIKTGFGDSLKRAYPTPDSNSSVRPKEVDKKVTPFKVGDNVKIVGDNATYANSSEGVKVPMWVKAKTLTIKQLSKDETRVLLDPINSWTYTSNIQKV